MFLKAVILIGGPQKGTRFRPLSFDIPKPLFPVAGVPTIQHLIEACCQLNGLREIILIGFYQADESITSFVMSMMKEHRVNISVGNSPVQALMRSLHANASDHTQKRNETAVVKVENGGCLPFLDVKVSRNVDGNLTTSVYRKPTHIERYLQEYTALGTAGGMYHFRDQIRSGNPDAFFLINGDVCGYFPLQEMVNFHQGRERKVLVTVLGTEATRQQSQQYGCIVENKDTHEVMHYVEKPSTFVSTTINCGIYICSLDIFDHLSTVFDLKQKEYYCGYNTFENSGNVKDCIRFEQDILTPLAGTEKIFVFNRSTWWSQIKTAGSAIYANRHYMELYHRTHPERLAKNTEGSPHIIGDVFIHHSASVHPSATLGPNVSIGKHVTVGVGVRIRESIILGNASIQDHAVVLHSIIGWNSTVGTWARVEGTPCDPNPNKVFAKMENVPLFNTSGRLNPSITVLGGDVQVPSEVIVLNCIVLPYKDLSQSYKNEIIL